METIIDVIRAVSYDALNETQKAKAIDIMRDLENQDTTPFWSVNIVDDWKETLESEYGILESDIQWSGFCCQGDGASISTESYIDLEKFLRKCKVWSKFRVLHRIIKDEEIHAKVDRGGRSYHDCSVRGNVELDYNIDWTTKQEAAREELEEFLTETIRGLSRKLYNELYKENDYQSSDDALWSTIECNEYSFKVNSCDDVLGLA